MMRLFCVFLQVVVLWLFGPQYAWADEEAKIREVLEQNFQACNEENLKVLMGTLDRQLPRRDEFQQEARALFADTDVYLRVQDFELLEIQGPWAAARVVQLTLPKEDKDREVGSAQRIAFRRQSVLLPEWDLVEYTQMFHKSGGKWRLWVITTQPQPVQGEQSDAIDDGQSVTRVMPGPSPVMPGPSPSRSVFGNCSNGRCRVQ